MDQHNTHNQLHDGFMSAFIDKSYESNHAYKPKFISNNANEGSKVLSCIENELLDCNEFYISVAFITMSGVTPLLDTFKALEEAGIKGKILTTNYLFFSEPKALEKLHSLSNIELKMYVTKDVGFHTKGYIFKQNELYKILVGSSNLTLNALTKNKEWNTKILSTQEGEYADSILNEFEDLWNSEEAQDFDMFYETYKEAYLISKEQRDIQEQETQKRIHQETTYQLYNIQPNTMQEAFIEQLKEYQSQNEEKALLISATGTGKTYASALALRELGFKKALFLVHREQIARKSIDSYEKVFQGQPIRFGLLTGTQKDRNVDYLFSTIQTMSKEETYTSFDPKEFDVIVIDEVHRAAANTYQRIMQYFKPNMWLGMTASPDRPDGEDIYALFDHNLACEIRLQQALELDLLCPFHYFGISDLAINDTEYTEEDFRNFQYLTCDDRVNHIIKNANYYGHSGDRVKGLMFCATKKEGKELERKFNERGLKTLFLSGDNSQEERISAVDRLVKDEGDDLLDYIITVDIFNEGIDIPEVNQVLMLRPTESPIIFIQQLGRGLRKANHKEYVVIIDFIGNYTNNYMIPIALSGDYTYNKDNVRRYVLEGNRIIPGSSTIHFDQISRKRIFESLDQANFSQIKLIKENYKMLKNKLGRIPHLMEFDQYGNMDVLNIFNHNALGSYYMFLVKYEKDYQIRLNETEKQMIEFISKKLANGKRVHELVLLDLMLNKTTTNLLSNLETELYNNYNIVIKGKYSHSSSTNITFNNIINVMTNQFATGSSKNTYKDSIFIQPMAHSHDYMISDEFANLLKNNEFREMVQELINFGIHRYKRDYSKTYKDTNLVLYEKYTYEDVCRLLDWNTNIVPLNIGGYKYDETTNTFPVFINYDKSEDIQETINYNDRFINNSKLISISKSKRTLESKDVQTFLNAKKQHVQIDLFIRKNKDDKGAQEFYYLGQMEATGKADEFIMNNSTASAVEIEWNLDTEVRDDIYEYLVKN